MKQNPFLPVSDSNPRVNCKDVYMLNFDAWEESFIHTKDHEGFQEDVNNIFCPPLKTIRNVPNGKMSQIFKIIEIIWKIDVERLK